ncbi:MAG: ACP S-malonyltransferase [Rickettsia sp.]|nr:ACP S-malonyltransferase [Rickettsia sp.]
MKRAVIFPGQGSQHVGMCKDLYDNFQIVRDMFEKMDSIMGYKLSKIILEGPTNDLTLTKNAQPAIMTVSMSLLRVFSNILGISDISTFFQYTAGHSLGEYTALCASGAINFEDSLELLKIRGNAMHDASSKSETSMAACIGISAEKLTSIIEENANGSICEIANDNSKSQVVISGEKYFVEEITEKVKKLGFRAILLNVSGAFHSRFMIPAQNVMESALNKITFKSPTIPILLNTTAKICNKPSKIKNNLVDQIVSTVRWREIMEEFDSLKVEEIIEIGPSKVLSNLFKNTDGKIKLFSISSLSQIKKFISTIA